MARPNCLGLGGGTGGWHPGTKGGAPFLEIPVVFFFFFQAEEPSFPGDGVSLGSDNAAEPLEKANSDCIEY